MAKHRQTSVSPFSPKNMPLHNEATERQQERLARHLKKKGIDRKTARMLVDCYAMHGRGLLLALAGGEVDIRSADYVSYFKTPRAFPSDDPRVARDMVLMEEG